MMAAAVAPRIAARRVATIERRTSLEPTRASLCCHSTYEPARVARTGDGQPIDARTDRAMDVIRAMPEATRIQNTKALAGSGRPWRVLGPESIAEAAANPVETRPALRQLVADCRTDSRSIPSIEMILSARDTSSSDGAGSPDNEPLVIYSPYLQVRTASFLTLAAPKMRGCAFTLHDNIPIDRSGGCALPGKDRLPNKRLESFGPIRAQRSQAGGAPARNAYMIHRTCIDREMRVDEIHDTYTCKMAFSPINFLVCQAMLATNFTHVDVPSPGWAVGLLLNQIGRGLCGLRQPPLWRWNRSARGFQQAGHLSTGCCHV